MPGAASHSPELGSDDSDSRALFSPSSAAPGGWFGLVAKSPGDWHPVFSVEWAEWWKYHSPPCEAASLRQLRNGQAGEWEKEEACRQPLRDSEETQCLSWGGSCRMGTLTS